jgi:CubicO group peptidase (beta-lactamase class C family)
LRRAAGAPALAAGAQRADRPVFMEAVGVRDVAAPAPVTVNDRWHIGSITKSMTALLTARVIAQGGAAWTDTVGDVLGRAIPNLHPAYAGANFLHLLSHRAGLHPDPDGVALQLFRVDRAPLPQQRLAYSTQMLARSPIGPKEETFGYSNAGYVVAGAMLEAKTGQAWETLLQAQVLTPLGMLGAGFGAPVGKGPSDEPVGHGKSLLGDGRRGYRPGRDIVDNPAVMGPAGTVHARISDMLAYLGAHRDRSPNLLDAASWARLHTPPFRGTYALGWDTRGGALTHNGSNTLWLANALVEGDTVGFAATNDGTLARVSSAVDAALLGAMAGV